MEKPLALLLAVLVLLTSVYRSRGQDSASAPASSVTRNDFQSGTLQRTYEFNLYLPAGYDDSDARYPVIYLLHGRGDNMEGWLNVRDTFDDLIASGDIPPMIAVMPDMPSSERASYYVDSHYSGALYRGESVETAFFNDLLPYVDATYRTSPKREARIIGGYSMGGYGAIRYSLAHPEQFGGALVLSPAVYIPLPPDDSSTREFGAFGSGDQLFDETLYQSLNYPALLDSFREMALTLPLFIAVGDDEYKNPRPEDALHDLDIEAHMLFNQVARVPNITAEFRVYDGGHDWDVWRMGFIEGMKYLARFVSAA
ncbi:MAG: esterase family protein [Anaerolineae bacterium]|nr:esterase family protein [Anaerolineae bacterium]